tara:strand:- start:555 stop:905 length:351 start_codon:yes stop_codon:yes gene_type:complete
VTEGRLVTRTGRDLVSPCLRTTNALDRMRGLLFRGAPGPGRGLLIDPCSSVHTFAMSYPIDVVYLDQDYRVVRRVEAMRPWRMSACRKAHMTLELAAGQAAALGIEPQLEMRWCAA